MSNVSGFMSKAYSDFTTGSAHDALYNKWEGIINSGKNTLEDDFSGSMHFFDSCAFIKLDRDDENLRTVASLQRELNGLKMDRMSRGDNGQDSYQFDKIRNLGGGKAIYRAQLRLLE